MKQNLLAKTLLPGLALLGCALLLFWWWGGSGRPLEERRPGLDRVEGAGSSNAAAAPWQGKLVKGPGTAPDGFTGVWPGFRGPALSNISTEAIPLLRSWPEGGPKALWKIEVGEGFAAAAILKGRVYVIDYDHKNQSDALRCLSLADGQEIWRYTYPVKVKRYHGMSRTIPAVTEKHVVSLGPKCHVICCDPVTGDLRWKIDLVREFNVAVPEWYAGQCPLVEGGKVILGTGGDALVIAVDLESGKVLWKTPNPRQWQMTHSSITPVEFKGKRMFVYCASGGGAGVAAQDGRMLWETNTWTVKMANIPAPVDVGGGRIFLSGGYDAGSMMIQLKETGDTFGVETVFRLKAKTFGAIQQTPILYQDHLFGVRQDDQLVCLDLEGKPVWESGAANKFGKGPYMMAQGMIFLLNDDGLLTLAEASTSGFKKLAPSAKVLTGPDAWGPMALADGRMIVRDMNQMICLDVRGK
jgi:outer membrane protein assembly factor BamB